MRRPRHCSTSLPASSSLSQSAAPAPSATLWRWFSCWCWPCSPVSDCHVELTTRRCWWPKPVARRFGSSPRHLPARPRSRNLRRFCGENGLSRESTWPRGARRMPQRVWHRCSGHGRGRETLRHMDAPVVARAAQWLRALTLVRGADLLRWDNFLARRSATTASSLFAWSCQSTTHHGLWSLLHVDTTATELVRAAARVRSAPIAGGPSPAHQHTRGGTS